MGVSEDAWSTAETEGGQEYILREIFALLMYFELRITEKSSVNILKDLCKHGGGDIMRSPEKQTEII